MKYAFILFTLALLAGCKPHDRAKVEKYGFDRFAVDVLAFERSGSLPAKIKSNFGMIRTEAHLNGVLLVYVGTDRKKEGIYVDRLSLDGWGGSGLEIEPWSKQIAWIKEKKRE